MQQMQRQRTLRICVCRSKRKMNFEPRTVYEVESDETKPYLGKVKSYETKPFIGEVESDKTKPFVESDESKALLSVIDCTEKKMPGL